MPTDVLPPMGNGAPTKAGTRYSHVLGENRYGAHRLVALFVGSGNKVLDVGCGEGALSQRLADAGNEVISLESDRALARTAEGRGVHVLTRDIEKDPIDDLGPFDVIVCADVLEHLVNPSAALAKLATRLSAGGRLVCSIPNIAFYSVRFEVLLGHFEYTEGGILDRTHVRFFTHRTARELIEGAGFSVNREEISHYLPLGLPQLTRIFNEWVERGRFGTAVHRVCLTFPGIFAYQFVTESRLANKAPP